MIRLTFIEEYIPKIYDYMVEETHPSTETTTGQKRVVRSLVLDGYTISNIELVYI